LTSAEELKQYARAELLQQVNSGQFLSDVEVEAAFLYDWSRLHPEEIEKDAHERELLQELLLSRFSELNAGYMHYATGSSELTYGMNGAEFAHFLHECELTRLYDVESQKTVEKVVSQCLRHDTLAAMHDRGTLSRVGFIHALLRVVQAVSSTKGHSFSETLDGVFRTHTLPTITRLTSGPFRDHSHHDVRCSIANTWSSVLLTCVLLENGGDFSGSQAETCQIVRQVRPGARSEAVSPTEERGRRA